MNGGRSVVSKCPGAPQRDGVVAGSGRRGAPRRGRPEAEGPNPLREWVKLFERYWTRRFDQIRESVERRALEKLMELGEVRDEDKDEKE